MRRLLIVACLASLMVPADASASLIHPNDPRDIAGPIDRLNPVPIWLEKLLEHGQAESRPHVGTPKREHRRHSHQHDRVQRYSDDDTYHDRYQERLARQVADERAREDDGSKCGQYAREYHGRHPVHVPRALRKWQGCERWTRDHNYWMRRRETAGLFR